MSPGEGRRDAETAPCGLWSGKDACASSLHLISILARRPETGGCSEVLEFPPSLNSALWVDHVLTAPLCSEQQGTEGDRGGISGPRITCPPSSPPPPSGAKTMAAGGATWSWMVHTLIAALILRATGNQDNIGQPCGVGRSCQGLCDPGGPRVTSYGPKVG